MPFNGAGGFSPPAGAPYPAVGGTTIFASQFNAVINDIANNGLANCMTRDGQSPAINNIPMGGFKLVNLAAATVASDALRFDQSNGLAQWGGTSAGTANAQTITPIPAITSYIAGQVFTFIPGFSNAGATTLAVSGLPPKNVFLNGIALVGSELHLLVPVTVIYDGVQFNIVFAFTDKIPTRSIFTVTGANTWTKPANLFYAIVEVVGAGGGGGGNTASDFGGGGGGAGAYYKKQFAASLLGATETVTIGAKGTGQSGLAGTAGGSSSFGAWITCTGGSPGNPNRGPGGLGGTCTIDGIVATGQPGGGSNSTGAAGGSTIFGGGGRELNLDNTNGQGGTGKGSGGSGGYNYLGGANATAGGSGADGIVIVWEFYE
jgi:hypothetical protein